MESIAHIKMQLCWACLVAALLTVSGCSSLVGQEFEYGAKDSKGRLAGVPFTINRAVPTIVRSVSAGTEKVNYVVTFNYVPDSSKRYTLQIDPSILSSVDFSMAFDAGGSLTDVSSKSSDQTGAIIATIGKIALLAGADTGPSGSDTVVTSLLVQGDLFVVSSGAPAHARESWKVIRAELTALGTEAKIRSEYFYKSPEQRRFFQRFAEYLGAKISKGKDLVAKPPQLGNADAAESFWKEVDRYLGSAPSTEDRAFGNAVMAAFSAGDVQKLDELKKAQIAKLQKQRVDLETKKLSSDYQGMKITVGRLSVLKAAAKAMPAEVGLVVSIAELSTAEWARRALVPLAKEIEAKQQELRILRYALGLEAKSSSTETESAEAEKAQRKLVDKRERALKSPQEQASEDLNKLLVKKAIILGVGREAERRQELADMLSSASSPKNFKPIRDERDALDTAVANAEANTKAKAKEAEVDDPYIGRYMNVPPSSPAVGPEEIIAELDKTEERPRYVVVVRSLEPLPSKLEQSKSSAGSGKAVVGKSSDAKAEPISGGVGDLTAPKAPVVPPVKK